MDTEFFKELERFALLVKKRVSTTYAGGRKSLRYGRGITPVGYREYRQGDDFKLVDWKAYGRTEKLYVREHELSISFWTPAEAWVTTASSNMPPR